MRTNGRRPHLLRSAQPLALLLGLGLLVSVPLPAAQALEAVDFTVTGGDEDLTDLIHDASALWKRRKQKNPSAVDLFAEAQAEYQLLLQALYDAGYFSPVINVRLDGVEAAGIAPLDAPTAIERIEVTVDPGPRFTFSETTIDPLARRTRLPTGFAPGETASTGAILGAVDASVAKWRAAGHAKAGVVSEDIVADHDAATLAARIGLDPGPRLRFGDLVITGNTRMKTYRIRDIAGIEEGAWFSSTELDHATDRLTRTGVFSAVTFSEAEVPNPDGSLDLILEVTEAKRRRYSFGAELSTDEGLNVDGSWLHRNLLGGGERFEVTFGVANITPSFDGTDYALGLSLERPASPWPGTTAGVSVDFSHLNEPDFRLDTLDTGLNFNHIFSRVLEANVGLNYSIQRGTDDLGRFAYRSLELPMSITLDKRDSKVDPTSLWLIDFGAMPFLGFGNTDNGTKLTTDLRGYASLDRKKNYVFAARIQAGAILGADVLDAPRDELFYSGGGGTVRGQPYNSLGLTTSTPDGDLDTGGTTFATLSMEGRVRINPDWGLVAFYDIGTVGFVGMEHGQGSIHSGAGLGLRYATPFGPIRLDVAAPVSGNTGDGVQIYVGLGQSF